MIFVDFMSTAEHSFVRVSSPFGSSGATSGTNDGCKFADSFGSVDKLLTRVKPKGVGGSVVTDELVGTRAPQTTVTVITVLNSAAC